MGHLPQRGDLLLRGDTSAGFDVLDAIGYRPIEAGLPSLMEAIAVAPCTQRRLDLATKLR